MQNIPTFSIGIALTPGESRYPYLWKGLVGMWCPSIGKQGDNLLDLSLYNRPGILNNMDSTDYIAGINGYVLNYDGINDFVNIGNIPEINDAGQDISIIQNIKTTGSGNDVHWYYDNNDSLSPSTDAYLIESANLQIGGIGQGGQISTGIAVNDGLEHQIAVVLKGTTLTLYKDTIPVFSTTVAHNHANYATSLNFRLADNANVAFFNGDIGNTFLYNRALEQSEITDLFNNRNPLVPHFFSIGKSIIIGAEPNPLDMTLSLEVPTIQIDTSITPNSLDINSDIPTPLVGEVLIVTPDSLTITSSLEDPNLISDVSITPDILSITSSLEAPFFPVIGSLISKIISVNPLIAVTDTSLVQIIKIDTTDPESLIFESVTISNINNAKDVAVNSTNDFIYVAGSNGLIVKVEIADLTNQTTIDVSDIDDLLTIETNSNFGLTYAGTENDTGELYVIDERDTFLIDSDFRVIAPQQFKIDSDFNIIATFKMDSDFQVLAQQTFLVNTDFKCLTKIEVIVFPPSPPDPSPPPSPSTIIPLDTIKPIKLTDFQVFINSVELEDTDLILDSISIIHSESEQSSASFRLTRKHDQLDTTLKGISSIITNENTVEIKIQGITEFNGNISELDCQYNDNIEFVQVNAFSPEKTNQFNNITLSLPSLNSRLSLYDILIQNPKIFYGVTNDDDNPKKFKGIRVNLGQIISQLVNKRTIDDSLGLIADGIQNGVFVPIQNWTYFWGTVRASKFGDVELGETIAQDFFYIGTSLAPVSEELWNLTKASHHRQRIYDDEIIKLGDGTVTVSDLNGLVDNPSSVHSQLNSKGFLSGNTITNKFKKTTDSSELELIGVTSNEQTEVYEEIEKQLGFTVGEAPFQDISVRNGIFVTKSKLTDEPDRLSSIKEAGNNFVEFAKEVARLEHEKLKNINGNVLPDTSCTFNLTVDAYYYYDVSLLTKINVDNTTDANIYNNTNGFPVSVKSITITSADRRVSIQADNIKSTRELEEINGNFPSEDDDEYNEKEQRVLIALKKNMKTGLNVE